MRMLWLWHLMLGVALDAVHLVDIVEGTRRRRLVIVFGTRSTNTHEAIMWLLQWPSVQSQRRQLVRGNAVVPRYHIEPRKGRPRRCVLSGFSESLLCSRAASDAWRAAAAVDLHK